VADFPPLRVLLVGVASGDLDRLRRRVAADPLVEIVGATTVDRGAHMVDAVDAVILTPEADAKMPSGERHLAGAVRRLAAKGDGPPAEALTTRERDVLAYVAEGHGNRAISQLLGISEHTVKFHLASIYGKLGVGNRTEAAQQALRMGILEI
jgi:DNA-binding NarL/FixJ family response regulator